MARESSELGSQFTDLALASTNFGFLLPYEPLLVLYGAASEARMSAAPADSVVAARQFGEVLAAKLGHIAGVRLPTSDQPARLRVLARAGLLPTRVLAAFQDLHGFQGGESSQADALAAHLVERCFALAVWFFRLQTSDQELMLFVRVDGSDLRVLAERVALLEVALPCLRRDFELQIAPTSLPASEREQLIVSARDAAYEPLAEVAIASEVQRRLTKAGWDVLVADADDDRNRSLGCVLVEPRLPGGRRADMLLSVGGQVVGIIECKRDGADLADAMEQAGVLAAAATDSSPWQVWRSPLPYRYVSDGRRLLFCDANDPEPRARLVSGFHRPSTLARWQREAEADSAAPTYRARQAAYLPRLRVGLPQLRAPQLRAVRAVEQALEAGQRRALVQMATGTGRGSTEVFVAYRQLRYAKAARILFVVDRNVMAKQLTSQLRQFSIPDGGRSLADVYNVEELTPSGPMSSSSVVVATAQRLAAMLAGTPAPEDGSVRVSAYETAEQVAQSDAAPLDVTYCEDLPPDSFDLVIVDDCHHWLYGQGRALLEYFDAPVVGFSSTPVAPVFGFFNGNLVNAYTYEHAVADGLVVDYAVYEARFESSRRAVLVPPDDTPGVEVKRPRRAQYEQLDEDLAHAGPDGPAQIVGSEQLAAVVTAFRNALPSLFPERTDRGGAVPKTVVFALNDAHADDVVAYIREVFGVGNAFCQKITQGSDRVEQLLRDFRTTPQFRIAVVTDLISGVTDMRAVECMLILRDVRSTAYYEQLLAQGTQRIAPAELRAVTPGAFAKTQLVVVDAVGASRRHRRQLVNVTGAAGQPGRAALERLLNRTVDGGMTPDETAELGVRLARLIPLLSEADGAAVRKLAGMSLEELVAGLLETTDPDHLAQLRATGGERGAEEEKREAAAPLADTPELRDTLLGLYDRPTASETVATTGQRAAQETVRRRLAAFTQQAGPFTPAQLWWLENIADATAAAGVRFDPRDLDGVPFSGRGGTDGFLGSFGPDGAIDLLRELGRVLA